MLAANTHQKRRENRQMRFWWKAAAPTQTANEIHFGPSIRPGPIPSALTEGRRSIDGRLSYRLWLGERDWARQMQ